MLISELAVLKWIHILAVVYWLGGEWGVFQTSYNIVNRKLSLDERRRHLETAYRIDILARTGIILMLPLGLHMGNIWGVQPFGGVYLTIMWFFTAVWLLLCWSAFYFRETDRGIRLTKIDESIRYILIPALFIVSLLSLMGHGPFEAGVGQKWFAAKALIFSLMLVIGLYLRFIMREWTSIFRLLDEKEDDALEAKLDKSIRQSRKIAYLYWIGISSVAFLGAVKPF